MSGVFDGPPLVAGSLKGIRHFKLSLEPALLGVATLHTFHPGENVAEHRQGGVPLVRVFSDPRSAVMLPPSWLTVGPGEMVLREDHVVAGQGCACGFYAYYDLRYSAYRNDYHVPAVIEGYGHVTVGERGFRAEKARLVAVAYPPAAREESFVGIVKQQFIDRYPNVPIYQTAEEMLEQHPLDLPEGAPNPDEVMRPAQMFEAALKAAMASIALPPGASISTPSVMSGGMLTLTPPTPPQYSPTVAEKMSALGRRVRAFFGQ